MSNRPLAFDTNAYISYRQAPKVKQGVYLSTVVLFELANSAPDHETWERYQAIKKIAAKSGKLLTPTREDWWETARILYLLRQSAKSRRYGLTHALTKTEADRITRDALIARTVKRAGAALVTRNISDFELIKRFCDVIIIPAREFFGYDPQD